MHIVVHLRFQPPRYSERRGLQMGRYLCKQWILQQELIEVLFQNKDLSVVGLNSVMNGILFRKSFPTHISCRYRCVLLQLCLCFLLEASEFQFYIVVLHLFGALCVCVQDNVYVSNFIRLNVNIQSFHTICLHFDGGPITSLTLHYWSYFYMWTSSFPGAPWLGLQHVKNLATSALLCSPTHPEQCTS